uniref:Aquaporin 1 n=1 Tax=Rhizophagus irregularis TaxID=588596 RepID=A0A223LWY0_9GLOM|nr:aquaporin 1 [Rhizophagus irregularis]
MGEFLGTAYFLFMGIGGAINFSTYSPALAGLAIPFSFGFSLFVNVFIWDKVSTSVFNPAVTIALMITDPKKVKKMTLPKGAVYIVAQLLGGLVGAWLIDLVQPESPGAATVLADGVSIAQGLFLEMFATSVLTMAVLMLAAEGFGGPMTAFGVGMSLFISALCAGPYTGASLNPARTLGPAIVANQYGRAHWIYYVGPVLGGLLAAGYWHILNQLGALKEDPKPENNPAVKQDDIS